MTKTIQPAPYSNSRFRQKVIGQELARQYAEVLKEPTPKQFLDLLEKLDHVQPARETQPAREATK